ncbi:MAG: hypothetical protein WAO21_08745 [Verrucomicrobiia bacterium]|jgi:hypothetical protein
MRPRFLIGVTVVVLMLLALLLWLRPVKPPVAATPAPVQAAQSPVPPTTNPQPASPPVVVARPSATPSSPVTGVDVATASNNAVQTRELEMKQAVEGQNAPVRFYGMVIDQDSNALAGVSVSLAVRHNVYATPNSLDAVKYAALSHDELQKVLSPSIQVTTDGAGRFQWDDAGVTGDVLSIASVAKDGYELEPNASRSYGVASGSFDQPVIFKMWSTNVHEQLITGEKKFPIVPDGRPYVIDLAKGTIAESGVGDLKVWVKRPDPITKRYDWSSEVDVINGGLLAETDGGSSMYSAPADGYTPSFQFEQKVGSGWGDTTGPLRFYVQLNHGQEYGRIVIELEAYYNDQIPGIVRLSYAINPSGSRILR